MRFTLLLIAGWVICGLMALAWRINPSLTTLLLKEVNLSGVLEVNVIIPKPECYG